MDFNVRETHLGLVTSVNLSDSRKSRKIFGSEQPFTKLPSARPLTSNVFKITKTKRLRSSMTDTEGIVTSEKRFGTLKSIPLNMRPSPTGVLGKKKSWTI